MVVEKIYHLPDTIFNIYLLTEEYSKGAVLRGDDGRLTKILFKFISLSFRSSSEIVLHYRSSSGFKEDLNQKVPNAPVARRGAETGE